MTEKVTLPSGGWALLRDPLTVKAGDRKRVLLALDRVAGPMARQFSSAETIMALAVAEWSFDLPVPGVDVDSLDELSIPDYDAITEAVKPFEQALFPDFDAEPDPKAETPPGTSEGSNGT